MKRAVFLDRDGVLNRAEVRNGKPHPPSRLEDFELLPGVVEACARLRDAGFLLIVVTNQPDVARGIQSQAAVDAMHKKLQDLLPLDDIRVCFHDDQEGCFCRKPSPGLLNGAAADRHIDLSQSFIIGDRWKDIAAGRNAGCNTILIDYSYTETPECTPHATVRSLPEAVDWILDAVRTQTAGTSVKPIDQLGVKIFADGADLAGMLEMYRNPLIKGFTTNPTLMRKAGITDYAAFAREVLSHIPDRPISFEVFADEPDEMEQQALAIREWGANVYVKIPVTNTRGELSSGLLRRLAKARVKVNVTALLTLEQVRVVGECLSEAPAGCVSVFAGRIADTGRDPVPLMAEAVKILRPYPHLELIWASPRELLNIFHADSIGCHIITVTNDVLKKLNLVGKDLQQYSLETVKMFYEDAQKAGYRLNARGLVAKA